MEKILDFCNKYIREITCVICVVGMLGVFLSVVIAMPQHKEVYLVGTVVVGVLEALLMVLYRPRLKFQKVRKRYAEVWTYLWFITSAVIILWGEHLNITDFGNLVSYGIPILLGSLLIRVRIIMEEEKLF